MFTQTEEIFGQKIGQIGSVPTSHWLIKINTMSMCPFLGIGHGHKHFTATYGTAYDSDDNVCIR